MKITMSGDPGAGKSTVAKILAKKLGLKRYYIGGMMRNIAKNKGLTLEQLQEINEQDKSIDKEVDDYQIRIGKTEDDFIIEGRTSYFLIPDAIKIYLTVDLEESARRILHDLKTSNHRNESKENLSIENLKKRILRRKKSEDVRYKKYYNQNIFDLSQYDIVLDTTKIPAEEVANILMKKIRKEYKKK